MDVFVVYWPLFLRICACVASSYDEDFDAGGRNLSLLKRVRLGTQVKHIIDCDCDY